MRGVQISVLCWLLLSLSLPLSSWAQATPQLETVIAPQQLQLEQPVIDPAHYLSDSEQQQLTAAILAIPQTQAQIGVVVVPTTGEETVFDYSVAVAQRWQLGQAGKDNGLLLVAAIEDRKIQILTGYGLEGLFPDIMVNRIIQQQITPAFKQANYASGLQAAIGEINRILQDPQAAQQWIATEQAAQARYLAEYQQQQQDGQRMGSAIMQMIIGFFVFIIVGLSIGAKKIAWLTLISITVGNLIIGLSLSTSLLLALLLAGLVLAALWLARSPGVANPTQTGYRQSTTNHHSSVNQCSRSSAPFSNNSYRGGGGRFGGGGASGSW